MRRATSAFCLLKCWTFRPSAVLCVKITKTNQPVRMSSDVTYEELVELQKEKLAVIVDVREQSEIDETGRLPGSIHIPLGNLKTALEVSGTEFKYAHGVDKPKFDTPLVFSCKAGRRGQTATEKAKAMGFINVRNFEGGWLNWEKHLK